MARKRPCSICKSWFRPHPRAASWQRVCGSPPCQRERHRRACAAWHGSNPGYDREDRLRRRLRRRRDVSPAVSDALVVAPMRRMDWSAARDAVGLEVVVVVEEASQVLWEGVRDAVSSQRIARQGVSKKVLGPLARDGMVSRPRAP
jgi:hypothetical protein